VYGFSLGINAYSMLSGNPLHGSDGWVTINSTPCQL
jgi:hypothetical protein